MPSYGKKFYIYLPAKNWGRGIPPNHLSQSINPERILSGKIIADTPEEAHEKFLQSQKMLGWDGRGFWWDYWTFGWTQNIDRNG
jgi:hypothetical protein|tara:strand:+ start:967 stop:1218 length:252 start_codon:yes stop_codon:yes gene_type:complete